MTVVMSLQGTGVLVSEDDTTFQGEFSDDWTLNGKVRGQSGVTLRSRWRSRWWSSPWGLLLSSPLS